MIKDIVMTWLSVNSIKKFRTARTGCPVKEYIEIAGNFQSRLTDADWLAVIRK